MVVGPRYDGIQVARGVAALGVALYHSNLMIRTVPTEHKFELPFISTHGGSGVWLFFVISGFIIAKVVTAPTHTTGRYFLKRFFRIYPPYAVITLAALALQLGADVPFHTDTSPSFLARSLAIWPMQDPPFFQVGWTLEHEIVFYLIVGAMAVFAPVTVIAATIVALSALGVVDEVNLYFAIGIMFYVWRRHLMRVAWPVAVVTMVGATWVAVASPRLAIAGYGVASVAACVALMNVRTDHRAWRAMVSLGDVSFSLYLVHWFVFRIVWQVRERLGLPDEYAEAIRWTGVAIAIAVAYGFYRLVEVPSMKLGSIGSLRPVRAVRSASTPWSVPVEEPAAR